MHNDLSNEKTALLSTDTVKDSSIKKLLSPKYGSDSSDSYHRKLQEVKPIQISWYDLTVTHTLSGRVILDKINGIVQPGEFVALMGPRYVIFLMKIIKLFLAELEKLLF